MIPAAVQAWRPVAQLPLQSRHPVFRLGAAMLAIVSALALPAWALTAPAVALGVVLGRAGLRGRRLPLLLRPWLPIVAVVLVVHAITATEAAPLWHPSWLGLERGLLALARLALMLAATALAMRLLPLPDLTAAVDWFLRPLRPLGVDSRHLGLTLAVAFGTAPRTQAEAGRIQACLRLRRADGRRRRRGLHLRERLMVVPPLMEGLARRAETLPLALGGRVPDASVGRIPLPWRQATVLLIWLALLIVIVSFPGVLT